MNRIRKYFYKNVFRVGYDNIKGYCIAGIIVPLKPLYDLKSGNIHTINNIIRYYAFLIKNIIKNKIINYKLSKRDIVFE